MAEDVLYFKLKEYEEIDEEKYQYILDNVIYIKAQTSAMNFLGYKPRTRKEVILKLREKEYDEEMIERVLVFLEKYDYINDADYCKKYIEQAIRFKPKGAYLIKQELMQRGIDKETISLALEESEIDEFELAIRLLDKKYCDFMEMDSKEKNKVFGYLQRKGFSYSITKEAMNELCRIEREGGGE